MTQWLVILKILVIIGSWESSAITNKRPSSTEQSGSVRYFRHISNGPSSGPLADWEVGLREAIHQALLREGYWEPNLRQRLNSAQLIGRQDITSTFGDVVVLARGQIYAIHGGNFILLQDPYQNDCDDCHNPRRCERHDCQPYTPHNQEILVALWTVKRLRHRDVDRTRFELEYIINPVNAENDQIIMRRNRFNYAIPGHVFVIRSSETNKHYPEYYNRKIVQTHFKPEVILGVDSEGHKHVLYSYPGFITSPPQISTNEITTSNPSLSTMEMNTNFTKETEVYKKLLEALATKTSTTQKTEEGPHRFSLNRFADSNKVTPANQSETTIQPTNKNNVSPMPSSTKATVHYFMPTGEEVLMEATKAPKTTTEKVTPKTTTEKSTIKPTKKYYSTKTSFKPNTKKLTTAATTTSRKTTKTTTLITTTTSVPTTISITELLTPLTTMTTLPATPKMKFSTKSKYTPKIPSTSSLPKTTSFYPVYKRPKPFSPSSTKPTLVTTGLTTEKVTTPKRLTTERVTTPKILTTERVTTSTMLTTEKVTTNIVTTEETTSTKVPTTVTISSVITEPAATTVSTTQYSSTKIPIETSTTVSSTNKYSTIPTTFTVPLKTTTPEMYTNTEPTEEPSNISGSSAVPPTEPMQAVTEIPIVGEETEIPMSVQETQGTTLMPQEIISTTLIYSTNIPNTTFEATTQMSSSLFTTLSQIPTTPTKLPSSTTTQRTTTASDFLTAADPYKGPLYTGTVKNDYDADDIFGATESTTKPSTTTTESHTESDISHQLFDRKSPRNTKIIFSNFYKASTEGNSDTTINDDHSNDDSFLTSQSYETSVSYEVNKRNQPEYLPDLTTSAVVKLNNTKKAKVKGVEYKRNHSKLLHYKPSKIATDTFTKANVKQMPSNGTDYVIYKAEYPNEANETNHTQSSIEVNEASQMKTTKEAFDDVALMLINHAKSLEYLSKTDNKTVRVKYRRRKIYVPRSKSTRKPARKGQNQGSK